MKSLISSYAKGCQIKIQCSNYDLVSNEDLTYMAFMLIELQVEASPV